MLVLILAAALAGPGPAAPAPGGPDPSSPDLQQRMEAQPDVAAYRRKLQALGVRPGADGGFAGAPSASHASACAASRAAADASVALFKAADLPPGPPPALAGPPLTDADKAALAERARRLQQDSATWDLACLS